MARRIGLSPGGDLRPADSEDVTPLSATGTRLRIVQAPAGATLRMDEMAQPALALNGSSAGAYSSTLPLAELKAVGAPDAAVGRLPPHLADEAQLTAHVRRQNTYRRIKRTIDIAVILLALPALFLVMAIVAVVIAVTMGRPVLFSQPRVGLGGRVFNMIKFRTMSVVEQQRERATEQNDPRITPLGRFLRRCHIDELPQAWNILIGDMTLIGPRPEQPHLVEMYRAHIPNYDFRHAVTPGMSGWAQVCYGYAADLGETTHKVEYDLYYVQNLGARLDWRILLKTIRVYMDPRLVR